MIHHLTEPQTQIICNFQTKTKAVSTPIMTQNLIFQTQITMILRISNQNFQLKTI